MTLHTADTQFVGSPPRVRGKGTGVFADQFHVGITPACAGKSPTQDDPCGNSWDHPRVCGEKRARAEKQFRLMGSPPRVRGKAVSVSVLSLSAGITPACAGKRINPIMLYLQSGDHPRVCGEKIKDKVTGERKWGSPPRVRGKVSDDTSKGGTDGITPACAGKSPLCRQKIRH